MTGEDHPYVEPVQEDVHAEAFIEDRIVEQQRFYLYCRSEVQPVARNERDEDSRDLIIHDDVIGLLSVEVEVLDRSRFRGQRVGAARSVGRPRDGFDASFFYR